MECERAPVEGVLLVVGIAVVVDGAAVAPADDVGQEEVVGIVVAAVAVDGVEGEAVEIAAAVAVALEELEDDVGLEEVAAAAADGVGQGEVVEIVAAAAGAGQEVAAAGAVGHGRAWSGGGGD